MKIGVKAVSGGNDVFSLQKLHRKLDYFLRRYKLWVIVFLFGLTMVKILDVMYITGGELIPDPVLLGLLLAGITFLWIQEMRDRVILENINKILTDLDEMKTKFITIAGHELYTPLSIIKQHTHLMKDVLMNDAANQQYKSLVAIDRSVERLYRIVQGVLLIKNINFGDTQSRSRIEKELELFNFAGMADTLREEIAPLLKKRNLYLDVKIKDPLNFMVAHKEGIYQILTNLLLNAIRFTPDGGKIELHAEEGPGQYQIGIRDTGVGIPPEEKEKIFESFYEIKNPRYHSFGTVEFNSSGLGLGLAICKNIVETHGGKIWVESEVGKYSDFIFSIPKRKFENQPSPQPLLKQTA